MHLRARPAACLISIVAAVDTCAVTALELRKDECVIPVKVAAVAYGRLAFLATLCGDDDSAVGSLATIKGRCGSTGQH